MEKLLKIDVADFTKYDWFHSYDEVKDIVYVRYMNESVFNLIPIHCRVHFCNTKEFDTAKYYNIIEL